MALWQDGISAVPDTEHQKLPKFNGDGVAVVPMTDSQKFEFDLQVDSTLGQIVWCSQV